MSRYRFALRPRWILSHLFVIALISAMVWAGFWQLRRLDEKKSRNERVRSRSEQVAVPAQSLADPGQFEEVPGLEFRRVTATGRYLVEHRVDGHRVEHLDEFQAEHQADEHQVLQ